LEIVRFAKDEGKARAWLLTIVRRELARSFERKRPELADIDALAAAESALLAAPEDGRVEEMRSAIFRLEAGYREPLVLQVLLGYSTLEIAEIMGMQQGAVLTRLFRARQRLRQLLGLTPDPP
jgi:RNA polymerase sigma-70 factor (ECF subfamily)